MPVAPIDPAAATAILDAALPLRTDRLVLRAFAPHDLDAFRAYQSDPATVRYLWRPPLTEQQLAARVSEAPVLAKDGDAYGIAIEHAGALVGETVVKLTDAAARQAEIGWILAPEHRGRGYALEAGRAALDLALAIGAHRVTAVLDHENQASARIAERLGMRREAVLLEDGVNGATGELGSTEIWAILARER
ncbi:GNAT family N-acetyltransferase [Agrococcus sp. SGAir0287]|uniref:GNAT family N-acetyltransferase n=1 Tax=Agrococcus sp. SGAir0287 TaxID=2070347 RepID=UPI001C3042EC|nr:GNAT family N-acetyltransferase [Agrococcus sp. SGAir0287]